MKSAHLIRHLVLVLPLCGCVAPKEIRQDSLCVSNVEREINVAVLDDEGNIISVGYENESPPQSVDVEDISLWTLAKTDINTWSLQAEGKTPIPARQAVAVGLGASRKPIDLGHSVILSSEQIDFVNGNQYYRIVFRIHQGTSTLTKIEWKQVEEIKPTNRWTPISGS